MSFIDELSKVIGKAIINNGNASLNQFDKLPKFLSMCNYNDEQRYSLNRVKSIIQKTVRQIINVFPNFKVELLQFYDRGMLLRFVQMKANISVPFLPELQLYLMFPNNFPRISPYFRVVNPNPQYFTLKPYYLQAQSRNDPKSLILNPLLNETKNWVPSKSVVNIIIEINNLLRNNYPYQRIEQDLQKYQMWGKSKMDFAPIPRNTNNQPSYNNRGNNTPLYQPIPNNYKSINQLIAKGSQLCIKQKQKITKLAYSHVQILGKIQDLDIVRYSIQSQEEYLRTQNYKMNEILTKQNTEVNLCSIVQPKEKYSQALLNCFSSIKARGNVATLLQAKFTKNEISLEQFLKYMKKNEENKFMEKYLMIKLIDEGQTND